MSTVIICGILVIICVVAVKSAVGKATHGCCGGKGGKIKKKRMKAMDISDYKYTSQLKVEGMSCDNCKRHVENACNEFEGVHAEVDLQEGKLKVYMKKELPPETLLKAVEDAGYSAEVLE